MINSNITFYGIFMTSSMIMSILIGGFGNILLPLMLCSSDMIFPRLNAIYYIELSLLISPLVLYLLISIVI